MTIRTELNTAHESIDRIALVLDRQTTPDTHYVDVLVFFLVSDAHGFELICFALSPIEDATTQNGGEHIAFITYVQKIFGKSFENVTALTRDSSAPNQSFAVNLKKRPISCVSHCFQLFVRESISSEADAVHKVHALLLKLQMSLLRAELYKLTNVCSKLSNVTCWSWLYWMLKRHIELPDCNAQLDDISLYNMLLTAP